MKKSIMMAAALVVAGFTGNAFAQNQATATGTANATIIRPVSFGQTEDGGTINFGNIVSTVAGGNVVRPGDGTENYAGDNGSDPGAGNYGSRNDATFQIQGEPNANIGWSAGAITGLPAGFSLTLSASATGTGTLDGTGNHMITVGGTLAVPANAAPGTVSGSWTETAQYN